MNVSFDIPEIDAIIIALKRSAVTDQLNPEDELWVETSIESFSQFGIGHVPLSDLLVKLRILRNEQSISFLRTAQSQ